VPEPAVVKASGVAKTRGAKRWAGLRADVAADGAAAAKSTQMTAAQVTAADVAAGKAAADMTAAEPPAHVATTEAATHMAAAKSTAHMTAATASTASTVTAATSASAACECIARGKCECGCENCYKCEFLAHDKTPITSAVALYTR
jgi:hypothetical protein